MFHNIKFRTIIISFICLIILHMSINEVKAKTYASDYIASYYINLSVVSSNELSISTTVTAVPICDVIKMDISLQKKVGSNWVTICNWDKQKENTFTASFDTTFFGAGKGSYKLYIKYIAKVDGKEEIKYQESNIATVN